MRRLVLLLLCTATSWAGCERAKPPQEIPEAIRGTYGRSPSDAFYSTLGLEVDKDALRFSEMQIKIVSGKMVGSTYQIDEAEVSWARQDKLPKKCKGTVARQGERLLISMFKADADEKCESSLDGEWTARSPTTDFPKSMHGNFGSGSLYATFEEVTVGPKELQFSNGDVIKIEQGVVYAGRDGYLLVRSGTIDEMTCRGSISIKDDVLDVDLEHVDEDTDGGYCPRFSGERWSINAANVPHKPIRNGKVEISISGTTLKLSTNDEQGLKCEQEILRTGIRSTTDAGRDRIPVGAGEVLVLQNAAPRAGADGCGERLRNLAANRCEGLFGMPCDASVLDDFHGTGATGLTCPTHVVIGEATTDGRKVALLPQSIPNAVCFEMSGNFTGG